MFLAGQIVVPVRAGAPNGGRGEGNVGMVKSAYIRGKKYPYVSAQAYKRWLRDTMGELFDASPSPVHRSGTGKAQQAYTEGNPIDFPDDDIFGYMRAMKVGGESGTTVRDAVLQIGTLLSVEPARPVLDFGTMTRGFGSDDNPVIHEHEFYTADLLAPLLFDMAMVGTFTLPGTRSGKANYLKNAPVLKEAVADGRADLVTFRGQEAIRLPLQERQRRVALLLKSLADVAGGAKNALHYGDRSPSVIVAAVMQGGLNPFGYVVQSDDKGAYVNPDALSEEVRAYQDVIAYGPILGWKPGYRDDAQRLQTVPTEHPREMLKRLAQEILDGERDEWLEDVD